MSLKLDFLNTKLAMLELITQPHSFLCLVSPPASGKTSFLLQLLDDYPEYQWVFVSPLRALADEFRERLDEREMLVLTAEKLQHSSYEYLFCNPQVIFVLDEFHLIYDWGYSFRFHLLDIWYRVSISQAHAIALTATLTDQLLIELFQDSTRNFNQSYFLDFGNMRFKYQPHKIEWLQSKKWITELLFQVQIQKKRIIVFVAYRHQVDDLIKLATQKGIHVLGCKGGEVDLFRDKLAKDFEQVELIVSTSCLGHGVNLPSFDSVFITYECSESFWIQMAARGGRKGELFEVYSVSQAFQSKAKIKDFIRFYFKHWTHKMALCFWKEFSFINNSIKKETS